MKKLFLLLVIFIGCMGQESQAFVTLILNDAENNVERVQVPLNIAKKSGYIESYSRFKGVPEGELAKEIEENIPGEGVKGVIRYLQMSDISERDDFLTDLAEDGDKLHEFLEVLDYLAFKDIPKTNYKFTIETIKEHSYLGFTKEIFENSLRSLVENDRKVACKLYSELEDGNQIKDLLVELWPEWQIEQKLGQVNNQDPSVGHTSWVPAVGLSADCQTIVSGSFDNTLIVWQKYGAGEWQLRQRLGQVNNQDSNIGHTGIVYSISLSADGKTIVSGSHDDTIIVWQKESVEDYCARFS